MKISFLLLLALALSGASASRTLLQAPPSCSINVNSRATSEAQDAISVAVTNAFASCKAAGPSSCPSGCEAYAQAAGQAISQAFAKAASSVFASVNGGPSCFASGSARSTAQSTARATAASFAQAIAKLCNGASATQFQQTIESALAKVFSNAGVDVACRGGGSASAAADVVAKDTLTAIACSVSAAFSKCVCDTFAQGGTYTDTCWTGIAARQEIDANAWTQTNGKQCAATAQGQGTATEQPAPPQLPGNIPFNVIGGQTGR